MGDPTQSEQSPSTSATFGVPDWDGPFDIEAYLDRIPDTAITKGMFFDPVRRPLLERGERLPGRERYLAFRDYPLREYLDVVLACGARLYPDASIRQRLRVMGRLVYPTFAATLIGRVLFKFAGSNVPRVLAAVPRAYKRVDPASSATVASLEDGLAILEIRSMWDVPEASQVGVYEGGLEALGLEGEVRARPVSPCDCDLEIRWSRRAR
jgi:uncharacterized protein (TIGR02265 family)